jgi:hypothetical protein
LPEIILRTKFSLVAKIGCFVANYTLGHVLFSNIVANQSVKLSLNTQLPTISQKTENPFGSDKVNLYFFSICIFCSSMTRAKIASIRRARIIQSTYFRTFGIDLLFFALCFLISFFIF